MASELKPFLEDMLSMSTGVDGRTLQIHFCRPVTADDRKAIMDAHNAACRPTPAAPVSPDATRKCGELVRYGEDWAEDTGKLMMVKLSDGDYVRFDQAVELLAAERAKTERWHKKAMDAGVIVHSDGTTSHPMRKERDDLKADNAAKDAQLERFRSDRAYTVGFTDGHAAAEAKLAAAQADSDLLDAIKHNSWDLRCFDIPTGGDDADIGWRIVGHWQAKPHERTVAEVFSDNPRAAIRAALGGKPS